MDIGTFKQQVWSLLYVMILTGDFIKEISTTSINPYWTMNREKLFSLYATKNNNSHHEEIKCVIYFANNPNIFQIGQNITIY
jgi:hypothetical protein